MADFEHFVVTRFNYRQEPLNRIPVSLPWLEYRFDLFKRFCAPSVLSQSCKRFRWLVLFDSETPEGFLSKITDFVAWSGFQPVLVGAGTEGPQRKPVLDRLSGASKLITTRLDNDDAISRDFIERIQQHADVATKTVIQFPMGYVWHRSKIYRDRQALNAFSSMIEPIGSEAPTTIYSGSHSDVWQLGAVVNADEKPAWIQVVHEHNLYNRRRGVRCSFRSIQGQFEGDYQSSRESSADVFFGSVLTGTRQLALDAARMVLGR